VFSFTARRPASWFVERYIVSVYWAFTTITTVGYGDITATNNEEYILCLICMLIGVGVFTTVAAMLHSQLETAQAGRFDAEKKISKLVSFLKQRMVDPELRNGEDHHLMRGRRRRRRKTPLFSSLLCFVFFVVAFSASWKTILVCQDTFAKTGSGRRSGRLSNGVRRFARRDS
jgi:hypothetical protein